eukprot:3682936-Lingulodinium_polyedra.AAC.1
MAVARSIREGARRVFSNQTHATLATGTFEVGYATVFGRVVPNRILHATGQLAPPNDLEIG